MSAVDSTFASPTGSNSYLFLRNDQSAIAEAYRTRIDDWYRTYGCLLDHQFLDEFAKQPEPRYWELVTAEVIENKSAVQLDWGRRQTRKAQTPDFIASYGSHRIYIEATTTDRGAPGKSNSVPASPDPDQLDEMNRDEHDDARVGGSERRQLGLRIQNSLATKANKLRSLNRAGFNIVAIGGGTIPSAQWHDNIFDWLDVASLFYPFKPQRLINVDGSPVAPTREMELEKINATRPVAKGFATRSMLHDHIAGVLFSTHTIAGLSHPIEPKVWWIENPYCRNSPLLRPAFPAIDRIVVHAERWQIEHLPPDV